MKTDAEINHLVAEQVMGLDITKKSEHTWKRREHGTIDNFAMENGYHNGPVCTRCGYSFCEHCDEDGYTTTSCQAHISDYCNDPAAWGALFVWLASHWHNPQLTAYIDQDGVRYSAIMRKGDAEDTNPGRALAIAALRAYGVEVE